VTLLPPMGRVQDALVQDAPQLGRVRAVQHRLAGQPCGDLFIEVVQVPLGARAEDRPGVVLGLQQAGDDERLVPAQDRGLGFDVGPFLKPAVQALLLALFRWSHRRVRAPRVSRSGTASSRDGKSSAGGRSPVSILLITSCETFARDARPFCERSARVR
jgi:hypothetical protein